MSTGKAVKIIDIDETGQSFKLNERALQKVFGTVPDDLPVALVSVVGAFRTGKSFLLDFFLKYLRSGARPKNRPNEEPDMSWMTASGDLLEGNKNKMKGDKKAKSKGGFGWRHGSERCTTGIWIWDEWFERQTPKGDSVAVFVLDTQGMYDSKAGQHLTASIFGLGTLLSSYTVYNLQFQIQEDHLQHLALFSEYGRLAASHGNGETDDDGETIKPFQKLEFLIRDFSKFDDLDDPLDKLHREMDEYLDNVMKQKFHSDLSEVRDQIELCYQDLSCYCLCHPGTDVSEKKSYDGSVSKIRPEFKRLLADYVRTVFAYRLTPKKVNGQVVSAQQLFHFVKVYCKLFQEAEIFPEAKTLLAATQEANNLSAMVKAIQVYKKVMDQYVNASAGYLPEERMRQVNREAKEAAISAFRQVAQLGSSEAISKAEKQLKKEIKETYNVYRESNRLRDPFAFVAPYLIPITIALFAYVARYILETVCPRRNFACLDFADFFGSMYLIIFTFLIAHMIGTGYAVRSRVGGVFKLVTAK